MVLSSHDRAVLDTGFAAAFGGSPQRYFSAPGRTEIGGNHTDHQHGRVLAGAVDLDTRAAVCINGTNTIRVLSRGYAMCRVCLDDLTPHPEEFGTTAALIRGVAAGFHAMGCPVAGFDAYCESTVLPGSGLSSSAAFEVLMGTVINHLFFGSQATPTQVAQIGKRAENIFFGKPCGLMDQAASATGGLVTMDFKDPHDPVIRSVAFDFSACGHALCIIDSRASHADLTGEYAAIPGELYELCRYFGKAVLAEVSEEAFYDALPQLRQTLSHRAILRAIHVFEDNKRVDRQVACLEQGRFQEFLELVKQSGRSSWMYLQNVTPTGAVRHQHLAVTLALCEQLLGERGAYRVHGGGFAGTVQAFVPFDLLDTFRERMDAVLGSGACRVLAIRPLGGTELFIAP